MVPPVVSTWIFINPNITASGRQPPARTPTGRWLPNPNKSGSPVLANTRGSGIVEFHESRPPWLLLLPLLELYSITWRWFELKDLPDQPTRKSGFLFLQRMVFKKRNDYF